jgi:hypothetical protein
LKIINDLPEGSNKIFLKLNLGESYSLFSNHIKSVFINNGNEIDQTFQAESNLSAINIVLEEAGVEYGELDRDGWFGDYYVPRTLFIKGNYINSFSERGFRDFYITSVDTVKVDNINKLENNSFPFTKGKIPTEPFFSSLWEPVIAISAAAIAIILFFSVRSK